MTTSPLSVLLINPPITKVQREGRLGPVIKNLYFNSPPLGIAYVAAVLERDGIPVQIIDAAVEDLTMEDTINRIREIRPSIVGLTSTTNFFGNAVELAEEIKRVLPDTTTVLGGPHVSSNCEPAMVSTCFDYACIGEGEFTMLELAHALAGSGSVENVKGLAYRVDGKIHRTEPRPLIEDLNVLPAPARHLLPLQKYIPQPNDGPYLPKAAMISSRGCPYECVFCDHGIFGNVYRTFSASRIVDEMEELVVRYGIRDIAFVDSLFMLNRKRVIDILDEIQRRDLKVHWTCTIRANIAARDILARMKAAGCWRVRIGVEAGNEEVLKLIRKQVSLEQVRRVVGDADNLGLHPKGFFMVGHMGETKETIRQSIELAKELPLTDITVQINTPLPGAPQWSMFDQYGDLVTCELEEFSFWEPVFVPKGMTADELRDLLVTAAERYSVLRRFSDVKRYARALSLLFSMFVRKRNPDAKPEPA